MTQSQLSINAAAPVCFAFVCNGWSECCSGFQPVVRQSHLLLRFRLGQMQHAAAQAHAQARPLAQATGENKLAI
jgi:hypothetical protein